MRYSDRAGVVLIFLTVFGVGAGCTTTRAERAKLNAGYQSLEAKQYDQAIAQADEYLQKKPHGAGSAEAMYLRGRSYEQKVSSDPNEAKLNLQAARTAYVKALDLSP